MCRRLLCAVVGTLVLFAAGCGSKVPVDGKFVKGGQPYTPKADEQLNISIIKEDGTGVMGGKTGPDGSFTIESADGKGVPVGKYKVQVVRYRIPAEGAKGPPPAPVTLDVSEMWEVSSSNHSFTIDVEKLGLEKLDKKKK